MSLPSPALTNKSVDIPPISISPTPHPTPTGLDILSSIISSDNDPPQPPQLPNFNETLSRIFPPAPILPSSNRYPNYPSVQSPNGQNHQQQNWIHRPMTPPSKFAFVSSSSSPQSAQKRPRRKYSEIDRHYHCTWDGCGKSYGTLNHLNAHIVMQKHGRKRTAAEFKELRKMLKEKKKRDEMERKAKGQVVESDAEESDE